MSIARSHMSLPQGPFKPKPAWFPRKAGSFLYFIQAINGGPIKIGRTVDLTGRLKALQSSSPTPLVMLFALQETPSMTERSVHQKMARFHSHGEWFNPRPDLLAYIDGLRCKGGFGPTDTLMAEDTPMLPPVAAVVPVEVRPTPPPRKAPITPEQLAARQNRKEQEGREICAQLREISRRYREDAEQRARAMAGATP